MKYGLTETTIENMRSVLARFPEIEKAVLYGSRAKGNFKTGSDIDLTLCGEALTPDLHSKIASALDDLMLLYTIDLSVFDELNHAKLREHIERVGVLFYARANQGAAGKKGWQTKTLGEVLQKTETINPLQSPEAEFDYIDVSSISNTTFQIEETQRLKGIDAPSRARRLVRANDVLFATVRPTLRRIAIVPENLDNQVCSTGYFVLRPKAGIDHRFVFYSLFTDDFMGQMETLQKGASYPAVTDGEVRAQVIPVPPLPEQRRIVGILDEAFEGIATAKANAEKNLQNARALFESHLQSVFTQRDKGWKKQPLASLCALFVDSAHRTPKYLKEGIPALRPRDVVNGKLNLAGALRVSEKECEIQSKRHKPSPGDIVYSRELSYGWAALLPKSPGVCLSQGMCLFRPCSTLDPAFLLYVLNGSIGREQAARAAVGAAHPHINLGDIKSYLIPLPPLDAQRQITRQLDALAEETQRLASLYERKLAALEALKKSLLHRAFTGNL